MQQPPSPPTKAPTGKAKWRPAAGGTLSSDIVAQIREQIFGGQLKPGDHLGGESSLAEDFGVSRMAMRDALRALAATGLIVMRRGKGGGVRIASAALEHVADALAIQFTLLGVSRNDLVEAQIASEATITRLAAERSGPEDVETLRTLLAEAEGVVDRGDLFAHVLGHFHSALAALARNAALAVMLRGILQLLEASYGGDTTPDRARGVLRKYHAVVDSIAAGDGPGAAARMQAHLEDVRAHMLTGG